MVWAVWFLVVWIGRPGLLLCGLGGLAFIFLQMAFELSVFHNVKIKDEIHSIVVCRVDPLILWHKY